MSPNYNLKIISSLLFIAFCQLQKLSALFLLALFFSFSAAAALTPQQQSALDQLNKKLQRDNERIFEEEQRKIDQKNLLQSAPVIEVLPESAPNDRGEKGPCFVIQEIILNDAKSLLKKERAELVEPYQGKCLTLSDIDKLRIAINNFYIQKGFIMSRAYLKPGQNIKDGVLEFEIKEGEVEKISINGGKNFSDRARLLTAFPYAKNRSFNLRDIEQGLDQINRLGSSNAKMRILPGNEEGKSIIEIINDEERTTHISVGYDNNGQESTGERRRVLTLQQDNLLRLNDSFYINYSHDQEGNNQLKHSRNLYANLSIPYGYWLYSFSVTDSNYLSTVELQNSAFKSSGQTRSYVVDVNRVIQRGKSTTTSFGGSLTTIDTKSFVDGSKLDNGSRKLTIFDLGLQHKLRLENGSFSAGIDYVRGLNSFGALQDQPDLPDTYPKAQFEMAKLNAVLYKRFNLMKQGISYRGSVVGQWSKDSLYSSEQINIGDPFSVRGFKNNSIASDNGGYWRNELGWEMPTLTERFYLNKMLGGNELFIGYDLGMVRSRGDSDASLNGKNKAYLSGWAAGIKNSARYFNYSFTYSEAVNTPSFVKAENKEIYFSLTLSL